MPGAWNQCLEEKRQGAYPPVTWKYLGTNVPHFNRVTETCKLCTQQLQPSTKKMKYFQAAGTGYPIIGDPPE